MAILQATDVGFIGHLVAIYFEGTILIVFLILLLYLYRIYRISKLKLTYLLTLGFAFYFLAVFFSWIAKWYLYTYGGGFTMGGVYFMDLILRFRMSLAVVVGGNYFFYIFFQKFFEQSTSESIKNMKLIIVKIIEIAIIIFGHIPAYIMQDVDVALIGDAIAFLVTLIDSIFFIPYAIKSLKKAKLQSFKKQYLNIGLMSLFILNIMLMFLIDRIWLMSGLTGLIEGRYSLFYFLAWISAILGIISAIRAFIVK